ncbi:hypothetical protein FHU32_001408 [Corynebacterium bovis DSM 20582 = CIP 54.80]|uniref:Uncharacterized protein n=1 Tax=Corynebacterium bovis DSM 20582 = CIP 54.80 TaxID=927655 RepID=A0A8H9Y9X7_9CORY|nr:hypothetical protein [Corynebacterium bovis DSM 20582 = CIP 54.80]
MSALLDAPTPARRLSRPALAAALAASVVLWGVQLTVLTVWGGRHGQSLGDVLSQWDTQWMSRIALHGYAGWTEGGHPSQWQSIAFFPGYPVLLRIVSAPLVVFGVESATLLAGCLLSGVLAAAMVVGLVRLVGDGLDAVPPQTLIGRVVAVLFDGRGADRDADPDGDGDADRDGDGRGAVARGRDGVAARVTAGTGEDGAPRRPRPPPSPPWPSARRCPPCTGCRTPSRSSVSAPCGAWSCCGGTASSPPARSPGSRG